jgi:hypothetical protein
MDDLSRRPVRTTVPLQLVRVGGGNFGPAVWREAMQIVSGNQDRPGPAEVCRRTKYRRGDA